jgi:hypothetical protein
MDETLWFLFYDRATGRGIFKGTNTVAPEDAILLTPDEYDAISNALEWVVVNGKAVKSISPEIARDVAWSLIKRARSSMEYGAFVWDGSTFDADVESQRRIAAALQLAMLAPPGYSIVWTLADNSTRTLTLDDLIGVSAKLAQDVSGFHDHARKLRQMLEQATTVDEVNAITWATPTP